MSLGCNCEMGLSNTGRPSCVPIFSVTSSLIMVPLKGNDGVVNAIDLTASVPVWSTLINEADSSKRWFPLPQFENVELPKADSLFEEANSGKMAFLRQGKRSFSGELWSEDSTPTLLGKLQLNRCVDFGVFIIDVNGNLIGSKVGDKLLPIPVDNPSFDPKFAFATDSTVQKLMLGFDFDRLFDESTMYMITPSEAGVNFNDLEGLVDVVLAEVSLTNALLTATAEFQYGTAYNPLKYKGADQVTDWAIYDSANSVVAGGVSAVTEAPDGTYAIGLSGLTTGDVYELRTAKDGFEGKLSFTAVA